MDRNLGALSSTPGNGLALGLMYQWGRKDPYPGLNNPPATTVTPIYNAVGGSVQVTLTEVPADVETNLFNAIENPVTFYMGGFIFICRLVCAGCK
ncbi:MAG: hypothetical protein LIO97_05900 [Tannerellaceae bacterium]|nr:hypothetical protein [Tannerellaceae bacterium]